MGAVQQSSGADAPTDASGTVEDARDTEEAPNDDVSSVDEPFAQVDGLEGEEARRR